MNLCLFRRPKLPTKLYKTLKLLITDCWEHDPDKRPDFDEIVKRLNAEVREEVWNKPEPTFVNDAEFLKNSVDYEDVEGDESEEDNEEEEIDFTLLNNSLNSKIAELEKYKMENALLREQLSTGRVSKGGGQAEEIKKAKKVKVEKKTEVELPPMFAGLLK